MPETPFPPRRARGFVLPGLPALVLSAFAGAALTRCHSPPPLRDGHAAAALQVEPAGPAASQAGFEPLRPYEEFLAPPEVPDEPAQN